MNPIQQAHQASIPMPLKRSNPKTNPNTQSITGQKSGWEANPLPRMETENEPAPIKDKKFKCIYADDNKFLRAVMNIMLASLGIQADFATNGNEALELLQKNSGQYLFTIFDMEMGEEEENGHTAIQRWRKREEEEKMKPLPMYILTANSDPILQSVCFQCGATNVLFKPTSKSKLLEVVGKHLPPPTPSSSDRAE